jgi:cytochrome P450 family 6
VFSFEGETTAEFEVKELCSRYTTDVVATCAYGIRGNSLQDPNCEFRQMGREIWEPTFWNTIKTLIIFLLPRLAKTLKIT